MNLNDSPFDAADLSEEMLLKMIGQMLQLTDPIPQDAVQTAELFGDLHNLDAELANLTFDSYADAAAVVVRAGADGRRVIVCESAEIRIDVELIDDGDVAIGQIDPGQGAVVVAEGLNGQLTTTCDQRGRFQMSLPAGIVRFCVRHGDASVVTPWISRRAPQADER